MSRTRPSAQVRDALFLEGTWSRDAFLAKFVEVLPRWLRKCGVTHAEMPDAVQDVLVRAWESRHEALTDAVSARQAMMRIVANVAHNVRRHGQRNAERYSSIESVDAASPRDEEAWVEARSTVLEALGRLDEPTRALIYAHEIEGRTNLEIAAALSEKEDTIERRVTVANKRLRAEVERIERGRKDSHAAAFLLGIGFDPFDRAFLGAVLEAEGKTPRPLDSMKPKPHRLGRPNIPTAMLMSALVFVANPSSSMQATSSTPSTSEAPEQLGDVPVFVLIELPVLKAPPELPGDDAFEQGPQTVKQSTMRTKFSKAPDRTDRKTEPKPEEKPKAKKESDPALLRTFGLDAPD